MISAYIFESRSVSGICGLLLLVYWYSIFLHTVNNLKEEGWDRERGKK